MKTIDEMPHEFSLDEIVDRLLLLDKIEIGLEQSLSGETVSTAQAREQLSKWLK